MLADAGIPSVAKRQRGFDVPDFMAGGPREIFVPESGAEAARELLGDDGPPPPPTAPPRATVLIALVVAGALAAAGLAWLLLEARGY